MLEMCMLEYFSNEWMNWETNSWVKNNDFVWNDNDTVMCKLLYLP